MKSTIQFQQIPLSMIDTEDRRYCFLPWNDPPDNDLLESIEHFGILHPPVLRKNTDDTYSIVAGRKRITAIKISPPENTIFCGILPLDIEEKNVFSLILEESMAGRPFSIAEQAVFFEKMLKLISVKETFPILEQLGHKPQENILRKILDLRSLSEPAFKALHYGIIQMKSALKLLKMSGQDQEKIVQLINELHFGGSKQQKLIDLCTELIKRKEISLETLLHDFPQMVDDDKPLNIPQHGATLLAWLHTECYPRSAQAENLFKQRVSRLNLPAAMHISHIRSFEGNEISLSLRFGDWHSLESVLEQIKKIIP